MTEGLSSIYDDEPWRSASANGPTNRPERQSDPLMADRRQKQAIALMCSIRAHDQLNNFSERDTVTEDGLTNGHGGYAPLKLPTFMLKNSRVAGPGEIRDQNSLALPKHGPGSQAHKLSRAVGQQNSIRT